MTNQFVRHTSILPHLSFHLCVSADVSITFLLQRLFVASLVTFKLAGSYTVGDLTYCVESCRWGEGEGQR